MGKQSKVISASGRCVKAPVRVALAHVLADLADLRGRPAVRGEITGQAGVGAGVAARRGKHDARLIKAREHRDVVLAAAEARLIDGDAGDGREVLSSERPVDVVMHDPPDAGVVLADQITDGGDGHLANQRHDQRLEQQREPAARSRPCDADLAHPVLGAAHPRNPRDEVRLRLEEVQMAPRALGAVVHPATGDTALRAGEPGAPLEIDAQFKPTLIGSQRGPHDAPRLTEPQHRLEQLDVSHRATLRNPKSTPPTRNSEGPRVADHLGLGDSFFSREQELDKSLDPVEDPWGCLTPVGPQMAWAVGGAEPSPKGEAERHEPPASRPPGG